MNCLSLAEWCSFLFELVAWKAGANRSLVIDVDGTAHMSYFRQMLAIADCVHDISQEDLEATRIGRFLRDEPWAGACYTNAEWATIVEDFTDWCMENGHDDPNRLFTAVASIPVDPCRAEWIFWEGHKNLRGWDMGMWRDVVEPTCERTTPGFDERQAFRCEAILADTLATIQDVIRVETCGELEQTQLGRRFLALPPELTYESGDDE